MENKIQQIQERIEQVNGEKKDLYTSIVEKLETVLEKLIIKPCEAHLVRASITPGYRDDFNFAFEVGFWNVEEDRVDFGSEIWFEYISGEGITINHGTIGRFNKTNTYQFKRISLLNYVITNLNTIEDALAVVMAETSEYQNKCQESYNLSAQLCKALEEDKAEKIATIEKTLAVGDVLCYKDDIKLHSRLFGTGWGNIADKKDFWKIVKITPKKLYLIQCVNEQMSPLSVKKEQVLSHLYAGLIKTHAAD